MAEGQRMTAADVVAQVREGRLEDFVREAVVLVARELMEAEVSAEIGAGDRSGGEKHASQWVAPAGVGDAGWGDRAFDPQEASGQLLPVVSGAAPALRAGDRGGRAGGLCQWREHPQGRPAGGAAGDRGDDQGPGERDVPRAR